MSKKLRMTALLAVLMVILVLAIGLVACNPKTNTYKVTTQFNAEQGDVTLAPEAKDGNYEEGTEITVSVSAKSGYEFDALTVNTDENAALNNEGKYIFKVTADTQITVLFRSVAPAACEHKNLSALVAGKAATCMEAGVIAHYHCNDCNKDLAEDKKTILESTEIAINPNAHDFDVWVAEVPATCSATGTAAHKDCKLCHKHFDNDGKEIAANKYTLAIDSTAHNLGTLINGTPATCSAKGEKAHYHCSLCNKDIAEDKTTILDSIEINIDPTAHKYGEMQDLKPATCGATGTKAHKDCELCHKHFNAENVEIPESELEIPATGKHTYDKLVNGGEQGHEVHCSVCDAKQSETLTPHTYGTEYVQDGVQGHHQECTCGYKTKTQAHEKGNNPYTDYEGETHSFECEKCGRKVTDEHSYGTWQIDGEGKHYRACVCGKETAHGEHNFGDSPVYTDSKDGTHHTVKCTVCEIDVEQEHTPRLVSDEESGHHTECTLCTYKSETTNHDLKMEQTKVVKTPDGQLVEQGGTGGTAYAHRQKCECGYKTQLTECTLEYEKNEQGHWQVCSECNLSPTSKTPEAHSSYISKYDAQQHWKECQQCGYEQPDSRKNHDIDTETWSTYSNLHYHPCKDKCGYTGNSQGRHTYEQGKYAPTPDDEQNTHKPVCDICGTIQASAKAEEHEWGDEQTDDQGRAYKVCSKCKYETEHVLKGHKHHSETWLTDGLNHWKVCEEPGCADGEGGTPVKFYLDEQGEPVLGTQQCTFALDEDGWMSKDCCDVCKVNKVYTIDAGVITAINTTYPWNELKLRIPDSIDGVAITQLGKTGATSSITGANKSAINNWLVAISIPESVTTISKNAFSYCASLKEADGLQHASTVEESAFVSCALEHIMLNCSIVGKGAFSSNATLKTIVLGENVKQIGGAAFNRCEALSKVVVMSTDGVPTIDNKLAFNGISNLTIYWHVAKDKYDETKGKIPSGMTAFENANNIYYYSENPYLTEGGDLSDGQAWHFKQGIDSEHYFDLDDDGNFTNIQLWTKES